MTQIVFRAATAALVFSLALSLIASPVPSVPAAVSAGTYNLPKPRPAVAEVMKAVGREVPR